MEATVVRLVRLRDGRTTAYAEYGAPEGFVVVNAHGGLACRLDVQAADDAAVKAGVRLISPDRPGVGLSDPDPGRTTSSWARDVEQLLDGLGVERFAVMGWSMGGQYAAAVGHVLRHRVTRVAIVAGALPLTEFGVFDQLPAVDRYLTRMSRRMPWMAQLSFRFMGFAARVAPKTYGRLAARELGTSDGAVIRSDGFDLFTRMTAEAMRQPAGAAEEYRAWMRPWGFRPEDLDIPVDIWAGNDDRLVDSSWPHRLASRIPNATLNIRDGGHFVAHLHFREILDSLVSGR